jgi:hypothetical protein
MVNWITNKSPKANKRVIIKLPDGRVCSGKVTEIGGFELEYVDNEDLLTYMFANEQAWVYVDE